MKHLGTYLAHYMALLAGLAAGVASFKPALFETFLPFLGPHAAGIIGGAAALVAALHALGIDPPKAAAALLVGVLSAGTLHGCATPPAGASLAQAAPFVEAAVDVAVATAESKGLQPAQINAIAKLALAADEGSTASLSAIAVVVNAELSKLALPPGDVAAALILEDALRVAITARLANDPSAAQVQAAAALVIQDVINATGG